MDASTTALSVARQLKARGGWSQLTVITNGLRLASELAGHPGIVVLMLGGRVRWEALSVVGQLGDGLFSRINVQKAFLGAAGFTPESGLADATDEEAQIKRSMVTAAREVIAIVDHTKWERVAFATFCPTDKISVVLTDQRAPDAMVQALTGRGVEVRLLGPSDAPGATRADDLTAPQAASPLPGRGHPAAGRAARDLQAVRGDAGPRRRLARPPARRGPRAGRRERCRQEHAGQDPRRRPSARQRHDLARRGADADPRPGQCPCARDRGRPPGAAPLPRPDGRRERVHRPRPVGTARDPRLGRDATRGQGAVRGARRPSRRRRPGPRPVDGRSAADRDRQVAVGRGPRPRSSTSRPRPCPRTRSSGCSRSSDASALAACRCCS